jgi:uncharacterized membrane protein YvbJ
MYCGNCGNEVSEKAVFCEKCGTSLKREAPTTPLPEPPQTSPRTNRGYIKLIAGVLLGICVIVGIIKLLANTKRHPAEPDMVFAGRHIHYGLYFRTR